MPLSPAKEKEEPNLILHVLSMTIQHNERGQPMATNFVSLKDTVPEIPTHMVFKQIELMIWIL